jgi:hypothetical protein
MDEEKLDLLLTVNLRIISLFNEYEVNLFFFQDNNNNQLTHRLTGLKKMLQTFFKDKGRNGALG